MGLIVLTLLLLAPPAPAQTAEERALAAAARAILDGYHATNPEPGERKLHIVCWRPNDRDYAAGYRERVPRMMEHIQKFYATEMERNGFGPRSFNLDRDSQGRIILHEAVGSGNFADYSKPDGGRTRDECWPVLRAAGIDPDRETVLIFTNLSDWDPVRNTFVHKSPYYANGNHRAGLAWQLDSPELDPGNLGLKTPLIQDGEYGRIPLGKHVSIFMGGIAHEMGHAFGLPHCKARDDEARAHGSALMGDGNRTYFQELRGEPQGTFLTLAHALRLASHPQFSGSLKGMNLPAQVEFTDIAVRTAPKSFTLSGRLVSNLPVYAVIAYLDPEGNQDYNARTVATVPDASGRFSVDCSAFVPGKTAGLRLVACLVNGATEAWRSSYRVAKDGTVDVSALETTLRLADFLNALAKGDHPRAEAERDKLPRAGNLRAIADSVLAGASEDRQGLPPARVHPEARSFPLSRLEPLDAKVGWLKPAYDHLPRPDALIQSGAQVWETGVYAHAPARHRYDLAGLGWRRLTGSCGLPDQPGGSVVFVIKTDGREVYRSPRTEPGNLRGYDIDLTGVKILELVTEDAGDGASSDWGLWLAPTISR